MIPTTQPSTALGEYIEAKRLELGLTKSEAARLAGVSRGTWHEVEAGRRSNMLADTLNLFDKALGLERGTLRRISRPLDRRPDLVSVQGDAVTEIDIEIPNDALAPLNEAYRQRLLRLAHSLSAEQVRQVVWFIEQDLNTEPGKIGAQWELIRTELDHMRAAIQELQSRAEEPPDGSHPERVQGPARRGRPTSRRDHQPAHNG